MRIKSQNLRFLLVIISTNWSVSWNCFPWFFQKKIIFSIQISVMKTKILSILQALDSLKTKFRHQVAKFLTWSIKILFLSDNLFVVKDYSRVIQLKKLGFMCESECKQFLNLIFWKSSANFFWLSFGCHWHRANHLAADSCNLRIISKFKTWPRYITG